ncbi:hypothetical protein H5410_047120 [Solanum commersonii]|uniref:Uncharacterized protein n=1 Tax=Solanum commersonii TaxID=4109 RepID=A0A9J5XHQ5_SOLCO|nr:hypothetical protein H5410_047120 [Solanum commersonii]
MRELKLFNQLHDYPIILARRIGKSSSGTSNRFVGLTSKFNTTIEINPPYPQAAELRTWIKTIETELVAYMMKSTTPIGSIMLIPFVDEDNNGFATAIVSDEIAEKMMHLTSEEIYEICFVKVHITFFSPNNHKELVVIFIFIVSYFFS